MAPSSAASCFAGLQIVGTVLLPFASAYKDVFTFAVVIAIMAWRPTGLIQKRSASGSSVVAQKPHASLWPGVIASTMANNYLIALLGGEEQSIDPHLLVPASPSVSAAAWLGSSKRDRRLSDHEDALGGCASSPPSRWPVVSTTTISCCCW